MDELSRAEIRALGAIDQTRLLEDLSQLVRMPSVTGSDAESDAQRLVAQWMTEAGWDVDLWKMDLEALRRHPDFPGMEASRTEAWGLVGSWGTGDGPTLILNGHVDVVPPGDTEGWTGRNAFRGDVNNGRLYGRGACDMKGGLVCAWHAARAIQRAGLSLHGRVIVQSVVSEEDGGLGTFGTIQRGYRGDAAIIPEPTNLAIIPACAGALTFRLTVHGRSAHGSLRKAGESAIRAFWPIWRALEELEEHRNTNPDPLMQRFDPAYPLSIGAIRAGDWPSSVPEQLVAEGRYGVALGESPAQARQEFETAVRLACDADPWLREHPAEVDWFGGQFASAGIPADHPLVSLVSGVHQQLHGAPPDVQGAPYGSDLRLLHGLADIPTLHYGPGDPLLAHAPDESIDVSSLISATQTLVSCILRFCRIAE